MKRSRKKARVSSDDCELVKRAAREYESGSDPSSLSCSASNPSPVLKTRITRSKNQRAKKICMINDNMHGLHLNPIQGVTSSHTSPDCLSPLERLMPHVAIDGLHSGVDLVPRPNFSSTPNSKSDTHCHVVDYANQSDQVCYMVDKEISQPVKEIIEPVKEIIQPVKEIIQLVKEIGQPVKGINQSTNEISRPVHKTINQPIDRFNQLVNTSNPEPGVNLPVGQEACYPLRQLTRHNPTSVQPHSEPRASGGYDEGPDLSSGSSSTTSYSPLSSSDTMVQPWSNPDVLRRSYLQHAKGRSLQR